MAFGFGVGDILMLTNMIINAVTDIHDAPKELRELAERVDLVDATLESIGEMVFSQAVGSARNMRSMTRLKERVKEVLDKMCNIVIKYRDNEGRVNPFNRVVYGFWDKRGIGELVIELAKRTDDLTTFITVQTWRLTNQIRPLVERVLAGQEHERANEQRPGENRVAARRPEDTNTHNTVSDQTDQVQAVLDRVLQTERPNTSTLPAGQEDVSIEREIEIQLGQVGIRAPVIKALIEVINTQRNQFAHPEDIDPNSYTAGRGQVEVPKGWIMVIDSYNEVRSIIAQTYLELIRVWTVNNSGEWLFNRVESAGVQVETSSSRRALKSHSKPLVRGGSPPESAALRAISGHESFFRSEEKNDILTRIAQHRSRGIDSWHFQTFEYMLCFDKSVHETLTALAHSYQKRSRNPPSPATAQSKIILATDIRLEDAAADLHPDDASRLAASVTSGVDRFLETELHWSKPPLPIDGAPFRTKQIVLPRLGGALDPAQKEAKLSEISERTACRIRVTDERFDAQLVSVTGPREALAEAVALVEEALR